MRAIANKPSLSFRPAADTWNDANLRQEWETALRDVDRVNLLFASPVWFEHMARTSTDAEYVLALSPSQTGGPAALCPLVLHPFVLKYGVWNRPLARTTLQAASILGGEPVARDDAAGYRDLLDGIFRGRPDCDCMYLDSVPTDGPFWQFLQGEGQTTSEYVAYLPQGVQPWICIDLKGSFDQYVKHISSSSRYKIRKHLRDLREHGGGSLDCQRIDSEGQVDEFLECAAQAGQGSWKQRVLGTRVVNSTRQKERLRFLARQGILRSYVLRSGKQTCAFVIGYQYRNIYHYAEVGYDEALARLTPGNGLLYLLIEDLYKHDRPSLLSFGTGDAEYKRRFGNRISADAEVILFRKTLSNQLRRASHCTFQSAVRLAKKLLRRQPVA
jgi:CelD/BcsL family acetyltransferase involved in cellulose biosynthesis